jgi:hypothetical protein
MPPESMWWYSQNDTMLIVELKSSGTPILPSRCYNKDMPDIDAEAAGILIEECGVAALAAVAGSAIED